MPNKATLARELAKRRRAPLLADILWEASPEGKAAIDEFTPRPVPYYPNLEYIRRNWAPEIADKRDIEALVKAESRALKGKVISPTLARQFLPNMLTEGRPAQFGVREYGYPPNPERDARIRAMGLTLEEDVKPPPPPPKELQTDQDLANWERAMEAKGYGYPDLTRVPGKSYQADEYAALDDRQYARELYAKLGAVILGEKERLYGTDKAIERWNGAGSQWAYGGQGKQMGVWSDASNHAKKVQSLAKMLEHPANKQLLNTYLYYALQE